LRYELRSLAKYLELNLSRQRGRTREVLNSEIQIVINIGSGRRMLKNLTYQPSHFFQSFPQIRINMKSAIFYSLELASLVSGAVLLPRQSIADVAWMVPGIEPIVLKEKPKLRSKATRNLIRFGPFTLPGNKVVLPIKLIISQSQLI
jgi:hypothetical protein